MVTILDEIDQNIKCSRRELAGLPVLLHSEAAGIHDDVMKAIGTANFCN